jgi:hypothetical protein
LLGWGSGIVTRPAGIVNEGSHWFDLSELLGVNAGLIGPVESRHGLPFVRLSPGGRRQDALRLLQGQRLREPDSADLDRLQKWAADMDEPLSQLTILEQDGALLVRVGDALADPSRRPCN